MLHRIFRPVEPTDNPHRQEPASVKKLKTGDAWSTWKTIQGWVIDTVTGIIELPPHRHDRLLAILDSIPPTAQQAGVRRWHKILGALRSMALATPRSRSLFSLFQQAMKYDAAGKPYRVCLTPAVHSFLGDLCQLALSLSSRATQI